MNVFLNEWRSMGMSFHLFVYSAVIIGAIVALVFACRQKSILGWILLYVLEAACLALAIDTLFYFNELPGFSSFRGFFTALAGSCGLALMLAATFLTQIIVYIRRAAKEIH